MKTTALPCVLFYLFLAMAGFLAAQTEHKDPVVYADQKSIGEDALRAAGHVEVLWQDYVIYADAIDFNLKSRELFAEGRVTMAAKDMVLSGEKLVFNLKSQKGELLDTYGLVSPIVRYESDRLEQTDPETLTFKKLDFSSCAQILPRWKISGRRGKIKKEKYIEMRDVLLRVKNVPVFFLPYLRYPLKKDGRNTGFLFPRVGNSALRGFFLQNAFFWDIRPNLDLTLGLDNYFKLGSGVNNELRYLFRTFKGNARFYYFKYLKDNDVYTASKDDYYLEASHQQTLPFLNTKLALRIKNQSRSDFLRLFDNGFDGALRANSMSSFSWSSSIANLEFSADASRKEIYYTFSKQAPFIEEKLPVISLSLFKQKLGPIPGFLSLSARYQVSRRSGQSFENEPEYVNDFSSRRLTLIPSYQLNLLDLPWLKFSLDMQSKNAFYPKSYDAKKLAEKIIIDEPLHLRYQTVEATLQGPVFYRLFGGKDRRLKHTIEPGFEFRYASKVENSERLIKVDEFDYPEFSYAGFSLTSRLLANKGDAKNPVSEILSLQVTQQYFFDPALASQSRMVNGVYPSFSELKSNLRFRPNDNLSLNATLAYNYYIRDFSQLNVSLSYDRQDAPVVGSIGFSSSVDPYRQAKFVMNRQFLRGDIRFDSPKIPLKLSADANYDCTVGEFRNGNLNISFDYQCLIFSFEVRRFYKAKNSTNPNSPYEFRVGVSLGNLGMVGDFFGGK